LQAFKQGSKTIADGSQRMQSETEFTGRMFIKEHSWINTCGKKRRKKDWAERKGDLGLWPNDSLG
jgi:hypothetical protein